MTAMLEIEDIAVELGGRRVLHDVNLNVSKGELVALIGPNGAGKTTLLRTILGLQRAAAGRVRVTEDAAKPGKTAIGYVPQRHEFAWDFPISVANAVVTGLSGQLGLFRRPGVAAWEATAEALDRVQLRDLADRPIGQLSGGQRQRVLVARALVLRPTVLLLDEPYTGLDMPTAELLSTLFSNLAHEGRAVLMTTHDLLGALTDADRLALLNRSIVAVGTPAQLVTEPESWMKTFGVSSDSALLKMLQVMV
ncbi:MAG: anchored repeat-type ABC transporter ATP-binding subunit [Propionibacteriaceae bacterium]|jgi:manganese/iron transport system ATP-binding protein|nr:anchored repeat-type ABC transporter ATP-binding subunit [Propionibacteriaceae bacterium]